MGRNGVAGLVAVLKVSTVLIASYCLPLRLKSFMMRQEAALVQQLFSSDQEFTLNRQIAAFEMFLHAWEATAMEAKYLGIAPAIREGVKLMHSYYEKTDDSVVAAISTCKRHSIFCRKSDCYRAFEVLDPRDCGHFIKKVWDKTWAKFAEDRFVHAVSRELSTLVSHLSSYLW
jgi:hypothetical protein